MIGAIVTTPPACRVAEPGHGSVPRPPRPTTKIHRILRELARGRRLNRFEAEHSCRYWLNDENRKRALDLLGEDVEWHAAA
jgi:hypothetical protein